METTVGERINTILYKYKLNATELADKVGMTKQVIHQLANGSMKLSYNFVFGIARAFPDIDLRWVMLGERTEGFLTAEEVSPEWYNPLKEKDKQINELYNLIKQNQAIISDLQSTLKELVTKIPKA